MSNTIFVTIGGNNTIIVQETNPVHMTITASANAHTITIEVPGPPGPTGPAGSNRADIPFDYVGFTEDFDHTNPQGLAVTAALTLSESSSYAIAKTLAQADTTFVINRTRAGVTLPIGSVVFLAGTYLGIVTLTATDIIAHDVVECVGPAVPDQALVDVKITIAATR